MNEDEYVVPANTGATPHGAFDLRSLADDDPDPRPQVAREGKVWVRATACDRCLLGPRPLVGPERVAELLAATEPDGATFVCHRGQVADVPEAICATWWARYADADWTLRLADAMGLVQRCQG